MAKTYTAGGTVAAGDVATAAAWNVLTVNSNNLIVPPAVRLIRSTDLTSYTSAAAITWTTTAAYDTDGMFSAASPTIATIQTTGLYVITFNAYISGSATITRMLPRIKKNSTNLGWQEATIVAGGTESSFFQTSIRSLTAGDTISANVQIEGGSNFVINGAATEGDEQAALSLVWIGRTA